MAKQKLVKLTVRCTEEERDKITDAAHSKGASLNAHILERTLDPRFDGCQDWEWKRIVQIAKISRKTPARYLLDCALGEAVNVRELSDAILKLRDKVSDMSDHVDGLKKETASCRKTFADAGASGKELKDITHQLKKMRIGLRFIGYGTADWYEMNDEHERFKRRIHQAKHGLEMTDPEDEEDEASEDDDAA